MDGFFDLEIELSALDSEQDSLQRLFASDIGGNYETAAQFQPEAFFETLPQNLAIDSFDNAYIDMLLEQSRVSGEPTIDKILFTFIDEVVVTGGGGLPEPDGVEFFEIWQLLLAALGGAKPDTGQYRRHGG